MKRWWNKRFSRQLAILLAFVCVFAMFAGCSETPTTGLKDNTVLASEQISPSNPQNPPAEEHTSEPDTAVGNESEPISSASEIPTETSGNSESNSDPSIPENVPESSTFEVHFIDVGQADAALVLCDGEAMLIDGGNAADSNLIFAYLKKLSLDHLDYIVCTHAHEDHVGGLAGALNYATVDVAFSPVENYTSKAFDNYVTYLAKQGVSITVPSAGDTFFLGSATVSILGPISSFSNPNNTSIVLRIVYSETSFLFTGDAEREEEQDILNAGYTLDSTVLKVGHHGSETSTSYVFLREIMPEYAVISVGNENSYGHPTDAVLSRLRDAEVKVFRTDMQGDIICTSDGKAVSFSTDRNFDADTLGSVGQNSTQSGTAPSEQPGDLDLEPEESTPIAAGTDYILNTSTRKFHYPSCSSVSQMADKNKQSYNGTRDELIAMGYSPCGRCHP